MGLALHVGGIQADHKAQLVLVFVGQQKEMQRYGIVGYVLVKGLAVQVQKGGVDTNVISLGESNNEAPGRYRWHLQWPGSRLT